MPPQQAQRLLDVVNDGLRFGAHIILFRLPARHLVDRHPAINPT
jgi:hypothetical protein